MVAGVGVVVCGEGAHQGFALLIPRSTLATRTGQSVAAILAIRSHLICRASCCGSRANFLGVTRAGASSADGSLCGELAANAALVVCRVADSVVLELAGCSIAAGIIATTGNTSTIALLIALDNAIATTLFRGKSGDALVVRETG